ncbi:AAA family ATPase [bacterium]|nr:AAA family ATPase [bacterium]
MTHSKILLVGNIGAGKTTIAEELKLTLDLPYYSIDQSRLDRSDGSPSGEMSAWEKFLLHCQAEEPLIIEYTGVGPFRHYVNLALRQSKLRIITYIVQLPQKECWNRIKTRIWNIPYPDFGVPMEQVLSNVETDLIETYGNIEEAFILDGRGKAQ